MGAKIGGLLLGWKSEEHFRADFEVRCERADVREGHVPLAAQNHRAQVAAAAQQAGQVGGVHAVFVHEVPKDSLAVGGGQRWIVGVVVSVHEMRDGIQAVRLVPVEGKPSSDSTTAAVVRASAPL